MTTEPPIVPTVALAAALEELFAAYPTDHPDAAAGGFLVVADPTTRESKPIRLMAGQVEWLTRLVMDEVASCRNAHADGNGLCGHCGGPFPPQPTAVENDTPDEDGDS